MKIKKKRKFVTLIITSLFFSLIISLFLIYIYSNKITPIIFDYSKVEIKRLIMNIINVSIKETGNKYEIDGLFNVKYNSSGEIVLIDFNYNKSTLLLGDITNNIEKNIKKFEDGNVNFLNDYYNESDLKMLKNGIVLKVPIGIIMHNNFFNNIGPNIPVKISFARELETGFTTDVTEYGINNALLKLNINIKMNINVIMPIIMDNIENDFSIPISMKVIQGQIPSYYMDGLSTNSNIIHDN